MGFTVLERLFEVERIRRRDDPKGGFTVPVMHERTVSPKVLPLLVTSTRGRMLPTRLFSSGCARCGIFPCSLESEPDLLCRLLDTLEEISIEKDWPNRCTSIQAARVQMEQAGLPVRSIVLAKADLASIGVDTETAEKLMSLQGYVTLHGSTQTLVADLPPGRGLVVSADAGLYVRIDEFLGLMLFNYNTRFITVAA
jgi:hypothetical protein